LVKKALDFLVSDGYIFQSDFGSGSSSNSGGWKKREYDGIVRYNLSDSGVRSSAHWRAVY